MRMPLSEAASVAEASEKLALVSAWLAELAGTQRSKSLAINIFLKSHELELSMRAACHSEIASARQSGVTN